MSKRLLSLAITAALVLAACGGAATDPTTESTEPTASTEAAPEAPEAMLLSYTLEAGTSYSYEVSLDQHMEMTAEGDASAMGEDELPGEAMIDISGNATFTHTVSDGPTDGTYEVHITGEFTDLSVEGTMDGEPVDEIPDFAEMDIVDVTVTVDEQGNLIHEGETLDDPFGAAFGGLESFGTAPGMDPGQFVGPPFSDEEVTVGDSWTEEIETPAFDEPIVTTITSTVTDTAAVDGNEVLVIETTTTTSDFEIDLGELFVGMFSAFMPEDVSDEEAAEFQAMIDQLKFVMAMSDMDSETTTWFDPDDGITRESSTIAGANIGMDVAIPDETTGEIAAFTMNLSMDQTVGYKLLGDPAPSA